MRSKLADLGAPNITTGALSAGPPSSPANGDIWNAALTDNDGNPLVWQFQFRAGGIQRPWLFMGGPALSAEVAGTSTTSSQTLVDPGAGVASITLIRAGDYDISFGSNLEISTGVANQQVVLAAVLNGVAFNQIVTLFTGSNIGSVEISGHRETRQSVLANAVIKLQWDVAQATVESLNGQWLKISPVRIS